MSCTASTPASSTTGFNGEQKAKPVYFGGKTHKVEVLVLWKIMSNIPSCSVAFNWDWKHLSNLTLANPEFGVAGNVDIFLGADVFTHSASRPAVGPSGSPSAIKMTFGWVPPNFV